MRGLGIALVADLAYYINAVIWAVFVPASYEAPRSTAMTGTAAGWTIVLISNR